MALFHHAPSTTSHGATLCLRPRLVRVHALTGIGQPLVMTQLCPPIRAMIYLKDRMVERLSRACCTDLPTKERINGVHPADKKPGFLSDKSVGEHSILLSRSV